MSRFIESIKIEDQKAFLLDLHQKRVNQTFAHFGKEGSIDLAKIFKNLEHDEDGLYKLRIVYDLDKKEFVWNKSSPLKGNIFSVKNHSLEATNILDPLFESQKE